MGHPELLQIQEGADLAVVIVLNSAGLLGIAGELGDVHEGAGGDRRPGGDACSRQEVLLHEIHAPHQQVDVPHRATPHSAVDFNQPGSPGSVFALHMEDTLQVRHSELRPLQAVPAARHIAIVCRSAMINVNVSAAVP